MATWPTSLPAPLVSGYSIEPVSQVLRTDMEVGTARQRRITRSRVDMVSARWTFNDTQMEAFRAWFESSSDADGGASWFTINLPTGDGGVDTRSARFVGAPRIDALGRMKWAVSAMLELRNA